MSFVPGAEGPGPADENTVAARVDIDGLLVADLRAKDVLATLLERRCRRRRVLALAVHIGALRYRTDERYRRVLRVADLVYADGVSLEILARAHGARRIERCPTTDLGHEVIRGLSSKLAARPRIALLGGPPGLAEKAASSLTSIHQAEVVFVTHGYHAEWSEPLGALRASDPDLVFVGLGAPREHFWVVEHLEALPSCLILTCGGWFGFLAGTERRAPQWMRNHGVEWMVRLIQSPRRLLGRYVFGGARVAQVYFRARLRRLRKRFSVGGQPR